VIMKFIVATLSVLAWLAVVQSAATTHRPASHANFAHTIAPHTNVRHTNAPHPHTNAPHTSAPHTSAPHNAQPDVMKQMSDQINKLEQTLESVSRQMMQQQTFVEERIRSDGMSGIKNLRLIHQGTKPYFGDTHIGGSALSAHDHADYDRTIGLGEFIAVMNGVEFRTRHNDYKFRKPASSHVFDAVEDVPFPDVPPEVLNKHTLQGQIDEMRLWFKAFQEQNHTVRDYRQYFKPNLCYLEGAWTLNAKTLSEPFQSDRHHLDADSWFDLQEKIRFTSYGGSKSNLENFAFLPTTMYNITDGIPQFAQWNYRILCHPLKQDVPTSYMVMQDDLTIRMARKYRWSKLPDTRAARFKLNEYGVERMNNKYFNYLDGLMAEIPGKNNYGANMTDDAFGLLNMDVSSTTDKPLNTAMYHRWFKLAVRSAMGLQVNHRGYNDENMWIAETTQPNVMPLTIRHCVQKQCSWATRRVSYAIPLEIIYTTPLNKWNPYDLPYWSNAIVQKQGRNGNQDARHAFNGTSFRHYYITPPEFYKSTTDSNHDPADTAKNSVGVLDKNGTVKSVAPTGFRVITPEIEGVGKVRLRYPIFPVHSEGSTVGMELMALKDMVMQMPRHQFLYEAAPMGTPLQPNVDRHFLVRQSYKNPPGLHGHEFTLTNDEFKSLQNGTHLTITTSYNLGHQHELEIFYNKNTHVYQYRKCDGQVTCWDAHAKRLDLQRD